MEELDIYRQLAAASSSTNQNFEELRIRIRELKAQEHLLRGIQWTEDGRLRVTLCVGGDEVGVLYSAYT